MIRRVWPPDATRKVTLRASDGQYRDWQDAAEFCGLESAAHFLVVAADHYFLQVLRQRRLVDGRLYEEEERRWLEAKRAMDEERREQAERLVAEAVVRNAKASRKA